MKSLWEFLEVSWRAKSKQNHYVYEFGPFQLDATRRVLLKEGEPLRRFPKEFDTLMALVKRCGELLNLMRQVWQAVIVDESNLTTNISHLRRVLGETRDKHNYIVTVPGRGYRFVAGVREAFDEVIADDWANGIWRQPLAGGKPERLKGLPEEKLYSYAWSRDGKQFAFVRGSGIRDLVLLRNIK